MTTYLDLISLEDAKVYLRIDDDQNETDNEIKSMIKSALMYVERRTNINLIPKNKEYTATNGVVNVYDYPINEVIDGAPSNVCKRNLYTSYFVGYNNEVLSLNVGYTDANSVPSDLIDVAKTIIKVMYYEQESNKSFKDLLPRWVDEFLNVNSRFIL